MTPSARLLSALLIVLTATWLTAPALANPNRTAEFDADTLEYLPDDVACALLNLGTGKAASSSAKPDKPGKAKKQDNPAAKHQAPPGQRCLEKLEKRGLIAVVLYGSAAENLDIMAIDADALRIGPNQVRPWRKEVLYDDLNHDNLTDMVILVKQRKLGLQEGDRFLTITGIHALPAVPGPLSDDATSQPMLATAPLGASPSPATVLFSAVLKGVGSTVGSTATSYLLGSLGIANESDTPLVDLSPIESELEGISEQIAALTTEVNQALNLIAGEIQTGQCSTAFNTISDDVSQITTWTNILQDWSSRTNDGDLPPLTSCQVDDIENCMETWVSEVLDSSNGVIARLTRIHTELVPGGGIDGLLDACVKSFGAPASFTFGDTDYYAKVQDLSHYFYGIQAQAANLYAEARHFRAWQAAVADGLADPDVSTVRNICEAPPVGTQTKTQCDLAKTAVSRLYRRLQTQVAVAGAPYSRSNVALVNGTNDLWLLRLDDVADSDGYGCVFPLTSAATCGSSTGTYQQTTFSDSQGQPLVLGGLDDFSGYSNWQVADNTAWSNLMRSTVGGVGYRASETVATFMDDTLGFDSSGQARIFITNNTVDAGLNIRNAEPDQVCFLDANYQGSTWTNTSTPPWCSSQSIGSSYPPSGDTKIYVGFYANYCGFNTRAGFVPGDSQNMGFYAGRPAFQAVGETGPCPVWYDSARPTWWTVHNRAEGTPRHFRYPIVDISTLSCGDTLMCGGARSRFNPGGVPSMCGADFDAYFENLVPTPDSLTGSGC
ncbi:hypothetical protein Fbal_1226 [Ferrimonas balearica DSM 9799]|uniref:Uncharacterized protein n=1 Tax=Ferrimonas balearica (strain DSM 9799 / CCM 4581 / KCTC 23876 / PAT) TaxID=550540 RepID=E1SL57_FERBD|nr:hypothetical protein [Ferrimonas balearica]ADN75435.1 hypothetical protein Fbal_1226 [Ferrimonas balearica DSM 9799]